MLRFATATSEPVVVAEKAQERTQAGPCMTSIEEGRPVGVAQEVVDQGGDVSHIA